MKTLFSFAVPIAIVAASTALLTQGEAAAATRCSLTPPTHEKSETPASCVAADVSLDRLPAVGESATVTVKIRSQVAMGRAKLAIRLPDTLRLTTGSSGLSAPRVVGLSQVAEQQFGLSDAGRTVTFGVTALAAGPAHIEADVTSADAPAADRSAHSSATLTVGGTAGSSRTGTDATRATGVTRVMPTPAVAAVAGRICAAGAFTYSDKAGAWKAGRKIKTQIAGRTTTSAAAQYYVTGETGADGAYKLCFDAPVASMAQVWVEFATDNALWRVTNNAGTGVYTVSTAAKNSVASGTDTSFGTTSPTSAQMRGWHAFDAVNKLFAIHGSATCWTAGESSCRKLTLHWQPGSTDGTYWNNDPALPVAQRYVALTDADPDSEHTVLHESGHGLMDMLYAGSWPTSDCPSPHYLRARTGPSCAWTEGFANAIAGYAVGDGKYIWANGAEINLMTTTPYNANGPADNTNVENGDQVECRVAGAIIDLWRKVDNGPLPTFASMTANPSGTFEEWFTADRPAGGLDVSSATRDLVYTHTIDYRAGTPTPTGIVANGGFENGTASWTVTGGSVGNWNTYPAQSGSWYAWLGGNGAPNTDSVSQQITVPTTGTPTLGYYLRVATRESGATPYDYLRVQVVSGSTTTTLKTWSNTDATTGYVTRTADLSGFRGKTITLKFLSTEDSTLQTDFLVDNVAVTTA
ncbi:hypothetical protein [Umezawaea sp. Da 62-37]|uniref:hypothetical protein n=1 Tax=Umezawaea sp. Da 62-37 TaxID=3075927 RepID=UPI0028F72299|nr:hypothetical protein [Umezawaea sp. Da 62-37]WNV85200.1 hypothetical protein RM788_44900 [Umezawaea sp. Da 62-37]